MATFAKGQVVLIPFPFSDLTQAKRRPALVLAHAGHDDYLLCQITSNPYADPKAFVVDNNAFEQGSLSRTSYVRTTKLFTASRNLIVAEVGRIKPSAMQQIIAAIISWLQET